MDNFIAACVWRFRAVILVLVLILAMGSYAYVAIPKERSPDVQIPFIYVSMIHEGISPEDAERLLVRPMEIELKSIEGVKEMTAIAAEGAASVTLEFIAGFDSDKALQDVREKVDNAKSKLPDDTKEPVVHEINLSLFPVVNVILSGDVPERSLIKIARYLRDKIEEISTVLEVDIAGDRKEAIEIIIKPEVVENYGLSSEIADSIAEGFNKLVAAGSIITNKGEYSVKVPGLIEDVQDLYNVPVKVSGDAIVTLKDIAKVKKTFKEPEGFARVNGKPAIVLEVSKRIGTNIIETVNQVKQVVEAEKQYFPETLNVIYSQDISAKILEMLADLQNNIVLAIILVMIIVVYFVGYRSAILVAVSIPGAFLTGILIINFLGLTLNIVVLFSLILSVGMLVDSGIIVCELADRKMLSGVDRKTAYIEAAIYVKWPIIVSTLTTLTVFMPLLFWPGIVGQFMKYMPITLIAVLSGSLVMAIVFIPALGAVLGQKNKSKSVVSDYDQHLNIKIAESGNLQDLTGFSRLYYNALRMIIKNAGKFTLIIIGLLCFVYVYYINFGTGSQFFPDIEPDNAKLQVRARGNLSVYEQDAILREVENRIFKFADEVAVFYARSGEPTGQDRQSSAEDSIGNIFLEYEDWDKRRKSTQILKSMKESVQDMGGIIADSVEEVAGPGKQKPIELQIGSHSADLLEPVTNKVLNAMRKIGGFKDVEDSLPIPEIELQLNIDRALAARFGTDVNRSGKFLRLVTNGMFITTYRPDDADDEVDILVRFPEEYRNIMMLDMLKGNTASGNVPFGNFMTRRAVAKTGTIRRADGLKTVTIKADVEEGILVNDKVEEMREWFIKNKQEFDPNISFSFKGDEEQQQETASFLSKAFVLALFGMALVLVIQFNSFYDAFIILSAVFLSSIGVLIGLIVTNQPFGIVMSGVGVIALSGIVVNNNIIFIDTYRKLKKDGMATKEALLRTGLQRLRPILLTAGTTVLGLLPMVVGMNIDFITREVTFGAPSSQWWKQLSVAIAGGLSFATILTLFFTPALLVLGDRIGKGFKNRQAV